MRPPCLLTSDATATQAQFACYGLATVYAINTDPTGFAARVVHAAGWWGWTIEWLLAVCAALSLIDVIINREWRLHERFRWCELSTRHRHWYGIGMGFSWSAMIFVGVTRFDATGLMVIYTITVIFLAASLVRDATRRRTAAHASQSVAG